MNNKNNQLSFLEPIKDDIKEIDRKYNTKINAPIYKPKRLHKLTAAGLLNSTKHTGRM